MTKPPSTKNWRSIFNPLFYHRAGWHQQPISPSRVNVAYALEPLGENQIRTIFKGILSDKLNKEPEQNINLLNIVSDETEQANKKLILRAPNSQAAEESFIDYFNLTNSTFSGEAIDRKALGCRYDLRI